MGMNEKLEVTDTGRGYESITMPKYGNDMYKENAEHARLLQESSATDCIRDPGDTYLWVGENHHLNRKQLKIFVKRIKNWIKTGTLRFEETVIDTDSKSKVIDTLLEACGINDIDFKFGICYNCNELKFQSTDGCKLCPGCQNETLNDMTEEDIEDTRDEGNEEYTLQLEELYKKYKTINLYIDKYKKRNKKEVN